MERTSIASSYLSKVSGISSDTQTCAEFAFISDETGDVDMPTLHSDRNRLRDYQPHEFPVLTPTPGQLENQVLLLALYKEACQNWRALLDIRFKLLALVPTISFLFIAGLLSSKDSLLANPPQLRLALAFLGAIVTLGLFIYELRNSDLYTDLGSRARRIEYELGVQTGLFLGRLLRQNRVVDHQFALWLIYGAALIAWLSTVLVLWCGQSG